MSHFAFVEDGVVRRVIVAEHDFINSGAVGNPEQWIQTSYNTRGGVHYGPDGRPDGKPALRGNYAGVGYIYDATLDAFYVPQPYPSWQLDTTTFTWMPPILPPNDHQAWAWNEATFSWIEIPPLVRS